MAQEYVTQTRVAMEIPEGTLEIPIIETYIPAGYYCETCVGCFENEESLIQHVSKEHGGHIFPQHECQAGCTHPKRTVYFRGQWCSDCKILTKESSFQVVGCAMGAKKPGDITDVLLSTEERDDCTELTLDIQDLDEMSIKGRIKEVTDLIKDNHQTGQIKDCAVQRITVGEHDVLQNIGFTTVTKPNIQISTSGIPFTSENMTSEQKCDQSQSNYHYQVTTQVNTTECEESSQEYFRNQRLHICQYCTHEDTKADRMRHHLMSVHGVKLFKCKICRRKYTTRQSLDRHCKTEHRETILRCDQCEKTYSHKVDLLDHVEAIHQGKRWYCRVCNKTYVRRTAYVSHCARYHDQGTGIIQDSM